MSVAEKRITVELSNKEIQMLQKFMEVQQQEEQKQIQQEEAKKNHNFIQLYRDHMPELRWLMTKHPFASSILFFLIEHMDNQNALVCSYTVLEEYFEKHRTTISKSIKLLKESGFIDSFKSGTSNVYVVNPDLAWSTYNTSKKFAKFDGKVLVSKKENKDYEFQSQFDRFKALREKNNL